MSVSMKPGAMTLAVIERPPSSRAIEPASPISPALLAGLAVRLSGGTDQRHDGRNEDHPPAALAEHGRGRPLRYALRTGEVRVHHPGERLLAHPQQQVVIGDPGISNVLVPGSVIRCTKSFDRTFRIAAAVLALDAS